MTYGKRYNLSALLNIVSDEDDDWNTASSWNNAPNSSVWPAKTTTTPKTYPKSKLDEVLDEASICTDIEHLKTLYEKWLTLIKSDKQKWFFNGIWLNLGKWFSKRFSSKNRLI
jgi:hypothetical protein